MSRRPDGIYSKDCGQEWVCDDFTWPFISWRLDRQAPIILSAIQTALFSLLMSDLVAEPNLNTGQTQWRLSRTVSAASVAGWTTSVTEGRTTFAGPFLLNVKEIVPLQDLSIGLNEYRHVTITSVVIIWVTGVGQPEVDHWSIARYSLLGCRCRWCNCKQGLICGLHFGFQYHQASSSVIQTDLVLSVDLQLSDR